MPGLVPGIHAAPLHAPCSFAQRPGVDGRAKPGHDGRGIACANEPVPSSFETRAARAPQDEVTMVPRRSWRGGQGREEGLARSSARSSFPPTGFRSKQSLEV
ncbi:hypothetical protein C5688_06790 [Methylocystis sp. MitZ-2018]|nr:hypothetical protein C5688_06790 [Methylocystis sp. MitZ-2018]